MKFYDTVSNSVLVVALGVSVGILVYAHTNSILLGFLVLLFLYHIPWMVKKIDRLCS